MRMFLWTVCPPTLLFHTAAFKRRSKLPVVDAVQEFKIQTNFSADVGGYSGNSVINLVVRSGTNQYHGSLWEFFRNDKLAANDWFNNLYGNPRSILRYNQFGGYRRRTHQEEQNVFLLRLRIFPDQVTGHRHSGGSERCRTHR